VLKNGGEIRPTDLSRDLRQSSANAAEDAPCRPPGPDALRQVALHGFANRRAGVPGAQHGEFVGIWKIDEARFRRRRGGQGRFPLRRFATRSACRAGQCPVRTNAEK